MANVFTNITKCGIEQLGTLSTRQIGKVGLVGTWNNFHSAWSGR